MTVSRRGDPARIQAAQREGTKQRLISSGLSPERADELLAAFDDLRDQQAQPPDGDAAYRWAMAQPRRR